MTHRRDGVSLLSSGLTGNLARPSNPLPLWRLAGACCHFEVILKKTNKTNYFYENSHTYDLMFSSIKTSKNHSDHQWQASDFCQPCTLPLVLACQASDQNSATPLITFQSPLLVSTLVGINANISLIEPLTPNYSNIFLIDHSNKDEGGFHVTCDCVCLLCLYLSCIQSEVLHSYVVATS